MENEGSARQTSALTKNDQSLSIWSDKDKLFEIKKVFGQNLSDSEFQILVGIGQATNLNPFLKEIWAVKYGSMAASIFIGRDGYRKAAQNNPDYDYHLADAVYSADEFAIENGEVKHRYSVQNRGQLVGAYCVVKRRKSSKPMFNYVELKEYSTGKSLWGSKPATMIKKVAEAQGLRMAFQELFAGTYDESEDWTKDKVIPPKVSQEQIEIEKKEEAELEKTVLEQFEGELIEIEPISDEQKKEIKKVMRKKEITKNNLEMGITAYYRKKKLEDLDSIEAQDLITRLNNK